MAVPGREELNRRAERYIAASIEGAERDLVRSRTGQNAALNLAAFRFGRMAAAGWVGHDYAAVRLAMLAEQIGYVGRDGRPAALRTIASGMRGGYRAGPATLPPALDGSAPGAVLGVVDPAELERMRQAAFEEALRAEARRLDAMNAARRAGYDRKVAEALMASCDALAVLQRRGVSELAADTFGFGLDGWPEPGADEGRYGPAGRRPSIVLPWRSPDDPGLVEAYQYRHIDDADGPKIHWHTVLHPGTVWNAAAIADPHDEELLVVEGALAAATLWSHGLTSVVALPQIRTSRWPAIAESINAAGFKRVHILPDAGAVPVWDDYAASVENARVSGLPLDPDDLLLAMDGNVDRFRAAIAYGTPGVHKAACSRDNRRVY